MLLEICKSEHKLKQHWTMAYTLPTATWLQYTDVCSNLLIF